MRLQVSLVNRDDAEEFMGLVDQVLNRFPSNKLVHIRLSKETADYILSSELTSVSLGRDWTDRILGISLVYDDSLPFGAYGFYTNQSHWNIVHCPSAIPVDHTDTNVIDIVCGCIKGKHDQSG